MNLIFIFSEKKTNPFFKKKKFLRSHFDQLDLDGNGHVTISELYLMFKALKVPITQELLDKLIQEADANANGEIEFDEFIALSLNLQDTDSNAWASFLRGYYYLIFLF